MGANKRGSRDIYTRQKQVNASKFDKSTWQFDKTRQFVDQYEKVENENYKSYVDM